MLKREEMTIPTSCLSKARDDERIFVLLARDAAAPVAIRAWVEERIRLGKNTADDPQVVEALECAAKMESVTNPGRPVRPHRSGGAQPLGSGGGRSLHTLAALRVLMLAMEKDNAERPIDCECCHHEPATPLAPEREGDV